jgi:hypothetical protein
VGVVDNGEGPKVVENLGVFKKGKNPVQANAGNNKKTGQLKISFVTLYCTFKQLLRVLKIEPGRCFIIV